jgi:hypothetical protein
MKKETIDKLFNVVNVLCERIVLYLTTKVGAFDWKPFVDANEKMQKANQASADQGLVMSEIVNAAKIAVVSLQR